jgi:N-acetylated-alpha-linked acidic dipeptidase
VETLLEVADARRIEVDLSGLVEASRELDVAAAELEKARAERLARGPVPAEDARVVNAALIGLEKAWLDDRGLQNRPWSRSLYVSPDPFSGYASWMLPGIRFEIETDDPAEVPEWEARYVAAIGRLADRMRAAAELIREH